MQPVSKVRRVIAKQKATTLSIPTVPKASAQANGPADFVTELKYRAGGQRGERRCGNYVINGKRKNSPPTPEITYSATYNVFGNHKKCIFKDFL